METPAPLCTRGLADQNAKPEVILTKRQSAKCHPGSKTDLSSPSEPLLQSIRGPSSRRASRFITTAPGSPVRRCSTCNLASKPMEEAASGWGNGKRISLWSILFPC